jgi:hypothetical protein
MNDELTQQTEALRPAVDVLRTRLRILAMLGIALVVAGYLSDHGQFFRSYLLAFLYWVSLSLGCLAVLMMHHLAGGRWGFAIRRILEAGTRTIWVMPFLGIPVILGMHELYEWTHLDVVAADPILQQKQVYLNTPFFIFRAIAYFVVWGLLAYFLNRWSAAQDETTETSPTRRMQVLSGPGMILFVLTATLAATDWMMSLEPHWFSTIYAAIYIIGQILLTWAFVMLVCIPLSKRPPLNKLLTNERLRDIATLMLGFVMLWAYTSFSQLLIIWAANLPEEIGWYFKRLQGGWQSVGYTLIFLHFGLPFLLLISSRIKSRIAVLIGVSSGIAIMRLIDLFWITAPAFQGHGDHADVGFALSWMDIGMPLAVGAIWLYIFLGQLTKRSLVPLNDPRFDFAALAEEGEGGGH